jgi:hypothetical protein
MATLTSVWGIIALIGMVIAFLPCFGSLNWINIPFAGVGLILSLMERSNAPALDRSKLGIGVIGCGIAVVVGVIRLALGGGFF